MATPHSLSKHWIDKIVSDKHHPLYYQFASNKKIRSNFTNFFENLFDQTDKKYRGSLESRINRLKNHDNWLGAYDELRIMHMLLDNGLNAYFINEGKKKRPDICVNNNKQFYLEIKSLINDKLQEEMNKVFLHENIPSGKLVIIRFIINKTDDFKSQINSIKISINEIEKRLREKKFVNFVGAEFDMRFKSSNVVPLNRTAFMVGESIGKFISQDYLVRKSKHILDDCQKQIESEKYVILILVGNDWRFTQDNYQVAFYGHGKNELLLNKKSSLNNMFEIFDLQNKAFEGDGLFFTDKARLLPAIGVLTKFDNKIQIYINPNYSLPHLIQ
ncbi:MAG: hypothetical protein WCT33_04355 [Patescibacteria group bacterium]